MKIEINKYELHYLLDYIKAMKSCLQDAPVDFLGTGGIGSTPDKDELEWRDKWQQAYINAETIIEDKLKLSK